jgi:hypothetical protein
VLPRRCPTREPNQYSIETKNAYAHSSSNAETERGTP